MSDDIEITIVKKNGKKYVAQNVSMAQVGDSTLNESNLIPYETYLLQQEKEALEIENPFLLTGTDEHLLEWAKENHDVYTRYQQIKEELA